MIRFNVQQKPVRMTVVPQRIFMMNVIQQKSFTMKVEQAVVIGTSGDIYDGAYAVIPKVEGQLMETKNKYMMDDVNVHPIPYYSVGNNSGGNTVFIGSEVLINGN